MYELKEAIEPRSIEGKESLVQNEERLVLGFNEIEDDLYQLVWEGGEAVRIRDDGLQEANQTSASDFYVLMLRLLTF